MFLIGLGALLALLLLPGLTALRKTEDVYTNIRSVQKAQQESQASLNEIQRRMYMTSILVREALLDNSPVGSSRYEREFDQNKAVVNQQLSDLKRSPPLADVVTLKRLESELEAYWASIEPVFRWTPGQRTERSTFFLREQQRPRRQSILEIANELESLASSTFKQQYDRVNNSQRQFHADIKRINTLAFFIGALIAAGSVIRIWSLEQRAKRQRQKAQYAEDQLRHLSTQLMHAQEEERRTISRELHDEVGQMLTGLRLELGSLERLREDASRFSEHLGEAKVLTEQTLRTVRDLAVGLRPSVLELGLIPALQWQARHFSKRSGIPVSVHAQGLFDRISDDYKICIYRVVQETLTNCAKHSDAKNAEISVREFEGALEIVVRDDGQGFDPLSSQRGGLGLIGIEERVRELDGSVLIDAHPGRGSRLVVSLKLTGEATK